MRIGAAHTLRYRYSEPVFLEPQQIRLRPRVDGAQRLEYFQLEVTPEPAGRAECLDQEGNVITEVWFTEPVQAFTVHSSFTVETVRDNPFDFLLPLPERLSLPLRYPEAVAPLLAACRWPAADAAVSELAREVAEAAGWQLAPFLVELTSRLYTGTQHVVRPDGPPLAAGETLARGQGSCRDVAVLFAEACRAMGIAARFVSGYEAGRESGQMHAWTEVHVPGGGWRGYDAARGLAVAEAHVAVAASADPNLAAPVTGSYRGTARSEMTFNLAVDVIPT
jgi:transglutaminase-like putative cysteine protease